MWRATRLTHPSSNPVASSPALGFGFIFFGRLTTVILCNKADRGSLALRLACSPCKASPAELLPLTLAQLLVKRAIYKLALATHKFVAHPSQSFCFDQP